MSDRFILAVLVDGLSADTAEELAAAARLMSSPHGETPARIGVAVLGRETTEFAESLIRTFDSVYAFDDPRLDPPDAEIFEAALLPLIEREKPVCVLIPHSNNGMDLAPCLAIRTGRPLVTDCLSVAIGPETLTATRPTYGGRVHARVTTRSSPAGFIATVRSGVAPATRTSDLSATPQTSGTLYRETIPGDLVTRRRIVETVAAESGAVDISQSDRIVAVGRGIQDEENLAMIESLAESMGAVVACSRPVVDKQWLPKSRQVGTSGVTVKPSVYIAIGISGSFQHMGGIKGNPFLVAINKDPRAPVFDVADVGLVGDLFDIVPVLEKRIREQ
ncbi:electron transfer flavoprotein subunit alpha/FixB family protein [Bacteroidota bacterium]